MITTSGCLYKFAYRNFFNSILSFLTSSEKLIIKLLQSLTSSAVIIPLSLIFLFELFIRSVTSRFIINLTVSLMTLEPINFGYFYDS